MVAGLAVAVLMAALVLALGVAAHGLRPSPIGVLLALGTLGHATVALAACGFLLVTVAHRAFGAIAWRCCSGGVPDSTRFEVTRERTGTDLEI